MLIMKLLLCLNRRKDYELFHRDERIARILTYQELLEGLVL